MSNAAPYRFGNKLWTDDIIGTTVSIQTIIRLLLFSALPWVIGLLISFIGGRHGEYIQTPAFYVGSLGIIITLIGLLFGSSQQYRLYDSILGCYDITPEQRRKYLRNALGRHSNFVQHVRAASLIFILSSLTAATGVYFWPEIQPYSEFIGTYLPRFRSLETNGWYDQAVASYTLLILFTFIAFITTVLGTSASIMLRLPVFLWRIADEEPGVFPAIIKFHYAPAATFYTVISILWLSGVALMFYFLGRNNDWLSYAIVIVAFIFGLINFSVPQIAYSKTVVRSEQLFLNQIRGRLGALPDCFNFRAVEEDKRGLDAIQLDSLIQLMKRDEWVYPIHQTYMLAISYVASLVGTLIGWKRLYAIISSGV